RSAPRCSSSAPLRVRFYDVGQGLAALVALPDGRRVLVDTGESPTRSGCGRACASWHEPLMSALERDLGGGRLDLICIADQHSDHIGGATRVLDRFQVAAYVDNGRDADRPLVARVHEAASARGTAIAVVDPEHPRVPLADADDVRFSALLPR